MVFHEFRPSLKTKYVRIHPKTWYSYIAMRFELYGCRLGEFVLLYAQKGPQNLRRQFQREQHQAIFRTRPHVSGFVLVSRTPLLLLSTEHAPSGVRVGIPMYFHTFIR